jgi:hypothetical protein
VADHGLVAVPLLRAFGQTGFFVSVFVPLLEESARALILVGRVAARSGDDRRSSTGSSIW